jgi:Sulfotransferase domain
MIIHLISGPRNISTALMYAFAQRPDMRVLDEPFYGAYLQRTGLDHPGRDQILATLSADPSDVFGMIRAEAQGSHVFIKNMGHHVEGFDYSPIQDYHNVFLIRDPARMLASYAKVRQAPTLADIGLQHQAGLYDWLVAAGRQPLVLDGHDLRRNPEGVLRRLCDALGLAFHPAMLQWAAGPHPADGVWAPYWYGNVHQSTGFLPPETDPPPVLPPHLAAICQQALPYYERLKRQAILA